MKPFGMIDRIMKMISKSVLVFSVAIMILLVATWELTILALDNIAENRSQKVWEKQQARNLTIKEATTLVSSLNNVVVEEIMAADSRPELIRRYLEKYKSPLAPYANLIVDLSEENGFDYYWMVAIAQQESNLCKKIPVNSYNCWGYGIHSKGTLRFENYEIALKTYAEYLKRQYFDKGLTTPEQIMKKYCPNSNGSWARGVQQFITELEQGDF
ncbi:MAG: hypothetical protein WC686_04500 [Candidatus Shapirobacteria bacterium]